MITREQLEQDIKFLADRQLGIYRNALTRERTIGVSANSIVAVAYGVLPLEKQEFPCDVSDMRNCTNMWKELPEHRKTGDALKAMDAARSKLKL